MATESDPAVTRVTIVLSRSEDWHKWLFIRKDTAQKNQLWKYVDPDVAADQLPQLEEPAEPQLTDYDRRATTYASLNTEQRADYRWAYERWEKKDLEYKRQLKALADFNSEISKTIAAHHIYLIEDKDTPHERLATLKKHLAPSDATRRRDLIAKYRELQTPPKGRKVEEWLRRWVEVTGQCKAIKLSETEDTRAQEDFLVACKVLDPEYGTAGLRDLIQKERLGDIILSVEDYVAEFSAYLKRTRPISTGFSANAAELEIAKPAALKDNRPTQNGECLCGKRHSWSKCWTMNPEAPHRPQGYNNKECSKKVAAAFAKNPSLKARVEKAIQDWKATQSSSEPAVTIDDGKPPSNPSTYTAQYVVSDVATVNKRNERNERNEDLILDDGIKPTEELVALSMLNDVSSYSSLSNRFILDPGSNTHIVNTESWTGWTREYEASSTDFVGAGTGRIKITAWGSMKLIVKTPRGLSPIVLTHVALVEGFLTSLIGLARCRSSQIHFDSGQDLLYRVSRKTVIAQLEYDNGHWLVDADATCRPDTRLLSSFSTTYRPSKDPRRDLIIDYRTAHSTWGHPGKKAIEKLSNHVEGLQVEGRDSDFCGICVESKLSKQVSRRQQEDFAPRKFYRVAVDFIQVLPREADACLNGDRVAGHMVDQYSKWHEVDCFPYRTKAFLSRWLVRKIRKIQRIFNSDVTAIKTDNDRGYGVTLNVLEELCAELGIRYEPRAEYADEQNGLAERAGKLLVIRARAMRLGGNLPKSLSNELLRTAAYILNRTPTEALGWKTPYEIVWGVKPKVHHLRPIGCRAYVRNPSIKRGDKLESRALIGHLLGYDSTNIFRIWLPTKDRVIRARDVIFEPTRFYEGPEGYAAESVLEEVIELLAFPEEAESDDIAIEELMTLRQTRNVPTAAARASQQQVGGESRAEEVDGVDEDVEDLFLGGGLLTPTSRDLTSPHMTWNRNNDTPTNDLQTETQQDLESTPELSATQISNYVPDRYTNNAPRRRNLDIDESNILTESRRRRQQRADDLTSATRYQSHAISYGIPINNYLHAFTTALKPQPVIRIHQSQVPPPPRTWKDLEAHPYGTEFQQAGQEEYRSIWNKGCFAKTTKTAANANAEVLPLMWVFTYKFDEDGFLSRFKARLVLRGDLQQSYGDTYAATLAARTFRAITAIANHFGLELVQYDVPTAFLNALLDRLLYAKTPDGFERDGELLQVLRALYGLKESPLLWYKELRRTLQSLGIKPVPGFPCVYTNKWLILFVYVDDIVMAFHSSNAELHRQFEQKLSEHYQLKRLGPLRWFLGIRVVRDIAARKLWLLQDAYIDKVAAKYNIATTGRHTEVPMIVNHLEPSIEEPNATRTKLYQELVGHLAFLTQFTRPDLARAHVIHASHLINPGQAHVQSIRKVWRHALETRYYALEAHKAETEIQEFITAEEDYRDPIFFGASDAAFADDLETRRSSQGYVFQLFGMTVDWKSTLQRTVTKSTTEAELLALSLTGSEMEEWIRLFNGLLLTLHTTPTILCDNQQTVGIVTKEQDKMATKLKHVDIHQSWIRQEVEQGRLYIQWRPTDRMPADGMTKMLPRQKYAEFVRQLHLTDLRTQLQHTVSSQE